MRESRNKVFAFDNIPLTLFLVLNLICGPPPLFNLFLDGHGLTYSILTGPAEA